MRRTLTSRSSSSSFNTGFSYSTIAVDPTVGGRGGSPDFYSVNANCIFASFGFCIIKGFGVGEQVLQGREVAALDLLETHFSLFLPLFPSVIS
ncbi:hypothetical protein SLEP1_g47903 [Rubroshorea leprosula]|uniref:Uncharacterized protein n=1 Tax=Rubroshorea leprosula TaxID=152421 RepID=A0AAV5LS03_9ROSI|nr:hypothetical protein SLEP1_g47903 [Rubroshorea leprosula]